MKSHYGNWLLAGMTMLLTVIMTACSGGDGAGSAGSGSPGFRVYDWALQDTTVWKSTWNRQIHSYVYG